MAIEQMSDNDIATRMKELSESGNLYSDVFCQYAEELYNRYFSGGNNIARYYGLCYDDAHDAVQEAFIKLFNGIKNFNSNKNFRPWFYQIILNCTRDRYNSISKHNHSQLTEDIKKIENNFEKLHTREGINSIISGLPKKLKEVVILRNYADLSLEKVSEALGISTRQVSNRTKKAYGILKDKIEVAELAGG